VIAFVYEVGSSKLGSRFCITAIAAARTSSEGAAL
jgi:hypothetical protein